MSPGLDKHLLCCFFLLGWVLRLTGGGVELRILVPPECGCEVDRWIG